VLKLKDIVVEGAIVPALVSADRAGVVQELLAALVASGAVAADAADELGKKVLERERKSTTGVGRGVAVPHAKLKGLTRMVAAIGISARGVDFASIDKQPVYSVVLLVSPEERAEDHLLAMEVIFRNLGKDTFRRVLRSATTVEEVSALIEESDRMGLTR
jgi:mannitol/fructose-specific phosphotransferase system IIA component (Ntr-type)